jgi:ribosomal protein L40E
VEGAVCRGCGASNSPSWGAAVECAVCRGCGASNSPSWERLWKALYVEDAGPVTARVGERLWKALYVEDDIQWSCSWIHMFRAISMISPKPFLYPMRNLPFNLSPLLNISDKGFNQFVVI